MKVNELIKKLQSLNEPETEVYLYVQEDMSYSVNVKVEKEWTERNMDNRLYCKGEHLLNRKWFENAPKKAVIIMDKK